METTRRRAFTISQKKREKNNAKIEHITSKYSSSHLMIFITYYIFRLFFFAKKIRSDHLIMQRNVYRIFVEQMSKREGKYNEYGFSLLQRAGQKRKKKKKKINKNYIVSAILNHIHFHTKRFILVICPSR